MTPGRAPSSNAARVAVATAFVACLSAFVLVAMAFDVFGAGRASYLVEFLFASFFGVPALAIAIVCRRRWMAIACVAAWAAVTVLLLTPWHPRKQFVRDLFSVKPGMTVDEVDRAMGRYRMGAGKKWTVPAGPVPAVLAAGATRPDADELEARAKAAKAAQDAYVEPRYPVGEERAHVTGTMTYRWDDDAYDSDWGMVTYRNGRVTDVEFSPD